MGTSITGLQTTYIVQDHSILLSNSGKLKFFLSEEAGVVPEIRVYGFSAQRRSFYSHLARPGDLPNDMECCLFKDNIKPLSDDEGNRGGGRWTVKDPFPFRYARPT
jgi:hypothetical protein